MATVYLARDVRHNRKVALKVRRPDLGAVVGIERFLSEIEVTANLQHPNLLPLFDSGEAGGLLFSVMLTGEPPHTGSTSQATAGQPSKRARLREAAALVAGAPGIASAAWFGTRESPRPVTGRFVIELPESISTSQQSSHTVAISRDGRQLAILGAKGTDRMNLPASTRG